MQKLDLRVLYVDDHETIRTLFEKLLEELGVTNCAEAANGQEALAAIEKAYKDKRPFDLVFCDWNMPVMSGLQVLQTLRKDERFATLPLIMVTVNSEESLIIEAMRSGVSQYLVKPFDAASLGRAIQRVLPGVKR